MLLLFCASCVSTVHTVQNQGATHIHAKSGDEIVVSAGLSSVFAYGFDGVFEGATYTYGGETYTLADKPYDFGTSSSRSASIVVKKSGTIQFVVLFDRPCAFNAFITGNHLSATMSYDSGSVCVFPAIADATQKQTITYGTTNAPNTSALLYTNSVIATVCSEKECHAHDLTPGFYIAYNGAKDDTQNYTLKTNVKEKQKCAYNIVQDPSRAQLLWGTSFTIHCEEPLSTGVVVGVVIGFLLVLALIGCGIAYCCGCFAACGLGKGKGYQVIPKNSPYQ